MYVREELLNIVGEGEKEFTKMNINMKKKTTKKTGRGKGRGGNGWK